MAEIKSTLELVMERTRDLRLTDEEKRTQAVAEFRSGLNGLIQKHRGGALPADRFKEDLRRLKTNCQVTDDEIVFDEIAGRLNLDGDSRWALELLAGAFAIDPTEIDAIYDEYRQAVGGAALDRAGELRVELREKHDISGTAVAPNLNADKEWATRQERLHDQFEPRLTDGLASLGRSLR